MSCFFCFSLETRAPKNNYPKTVQPPAPAQRVAADESFELRLRPANRTPSAQNAVQSSVPEASNGKVSNANGNGNIAAQTFTFRQLASATKNFRSENFLGGGGFGRVYKGQLENGQSVAVKQLDRTGLQGNNEFLVEVMMLSLLHHENLVNLVGYCADGDQRLLVYEYMPLGSLEDHLFVLTPDQRPLSWRTRMKIASDAARGLEYLHGANPPVIFRDLKPSNILLDEEYAGKLSDFGLAKLGSAGEYKLQPVSSRVMGTYGYCAPEYARTGQLTMRSDVYSFGVVLLELISGRSAIDTARPADEENLVAWARPMFKDQRRYRELVDPLLQEYPEKSLNQAVAVAAMCLEEDDAVRPLMTDIVGALTPLAIESTAVEGSSSHKLSSSPVQPENGEPDDQSKQRPSNAAADRQRAVAEAIKWGSNLLVSAQIQARSNSSREDRLE